jgi:hypothetical protein
MRSKNLETVKNALMGKTCKNCTFSHWDTGGFCYKHPEKLLQEEISCESWRSETCGITRVTKGLILDKVQQTFS